MKKGEVWLVDLFGGTGHEQFGERPAIILASTPLQIAIVLPLTSNVKALRFPFVFQMEPSKENGLGVQSVALLFQIRAIDTARLIKKIGAIDKKDLREVDRILKKMFHLS